jgi:hypothetical protein
MIKRLAHRCITPLLLVVAALFAHVDIGTLPLWERLQRVREYRGLGLGWAEALAVSRIPAIAGAAGGASNLLTTQTTAAQSSYTFSPSAPIAGRLVCVLISTRKGSGTAGTPTLSGTNGFNATWTSVGNLTTTGSNLCRCTLFRGIAASGTAGNLTADYGGVNQAQCCISVVQFTDALTSIGSEGVVQSNTGTAANTSATVTLGSAPAQNSYTVFFITGFSTTTAFTQESNYTTYNDGFGGTACAISEWISNEGQTPDQTPTGTVTGAARWAGVAVEIAIGVNRAQLGSTEAVRRAGFR